VVTTIRHPAVPILGWGLVLILLAGLLSIIMLGYIVSSTRMHDIIAYYNYVHTERRLSDADKKNLLRELTPLKDKLPPFSVMSIWNPEPIQYTRDFMSYFRSIGIRLQGDQNEENSFPIQAATANPSARGIQIGIKEINDPPKAARALRDALIKAGFPVEFATIVKMNDPFYLIIAPDPG
jgi:hypothetical protein